MIWAIVDFPVSKKILQLIYSLESIPLEILKAMTVN